MIDIDITPLKVTQPNVGSVNVFCLHCPNCTKAYQITDGDGKDLGFPNECRRCGCPMDAEDVAAAKRWMDGEARLNHDPAIAALGALTRQTIQAAPEAVLMGAPAEEE